MSINLNDTTPAAPAGSTNVKWQEDISGNVSAYISAAGLVTASGAIVNLTAQQANISATNLIAAPTAGVYRISAYIIETRAGGSSSTLPAIVITWFDQDSGVAQSLTITPSSSANTTTTYEEAVAVISSNTGAIQYSTTGYVSAGVPQMQYALHIRVESLG
jgi:hypothetical protein